MKIVVTGGAGFIGSHLVESLVNYGHDVHVLDNLSTGTKANLKNIKGQYKFNLIDVSSPDSFQGVTEKVDIVFHLSALPRVQLSIDKPRATHDANVNGTFNMLEFAREKKVKKFIYACSSSVYGDQEQLPLNEDMRPNPLNPYALQKYIGELYCQMYSKIYGLPTMSMRFFNVYGSRMATEGAYKLVFSNWIESIRKGETMKIFGNGHQSRDFTHIQDVVQALVLAMNTELPEKSYVFNVGTGVETTINQLSEMFGFNHEHIEARPFEEKRKRADLYWIEKILGYQALISIKSGVERLKQEYEL